MARPFDPSGELAAAQKFKILAEAYNRPATWELCERFSILVVLCEEKAKILRELDQFSLTKTNASQAGGKVLKWPQRTKSMSGASLRDK